MLLEPSPNPGQMVSDELDELDDCDIKDEKENNYKDRDLTG